MYPALGLDYGQSATGMALATGPLVEPLPTIRTSQLFFLLPQIVSRYGIKSLVVGLPDGRLHRPVLDFMSRLKEIFPGSFPVIYSQDETLSTHDAVVSLLHTTPKRRRAKEHSAAAAIILESWLDSQPPPSVK